MNDTSSSLEQLLYYQWKKNVGLKHLISKVSVQFFFLIVMKRTVQTPVVSWIPVVCNVFEFNWLFIY